MKSFLEKIKEVWEDGYNVIANDKNRYIIALLEKIKGGGLEEAKCLEWVPRERFQDVMKNKEEYEAWYVGSLMCVWSFGNGQKCYIYGKEIEEYKKAGHELVVDRKQEFKTLNVTCPQCEHHFSVQN